ncbi:MAG: Hsp20/alpha crystallin family protein [Gammaproteobacteria bacterium]|jgi:HSP20 family protein
MSKVAKIKPETKKDVTRTEPTRALSPFEEIDRYIEGLFPRGWLRPSRWEWPALSETAPFGGKLPKVDIVDREKDILVRAEVPGIDKDNLDISITENTVTIKGTTHHEEKEEKGEYYRRETSHGSFARTVTLPAEVDSEHAKANYKDGVLELTVPKVKKSQRRTIKID